MIQLPPSKQPPQPSPPPRRDFITDPEEIARLTPEEREAEYRRQIEYARAIAELKADIANPQRHWAKKMRADLRGFSTESLSIQDMEGRLVPYAWNPAQERLNAEIDRIRAAGRPVRIVILKERRGGFSTGVAGRFWPETVFRDGQSTLVVAHEYASVQDALYPMYHRFQEHYRPYKNGLILPKVQSDTQHGLKYANGSAIRIATAKNLEGARSFGYRFVHFSEAAFYPDFTTLLTAVMQTVPNDPDTMVIVESTANGIGGKFYDLCMEAMDPQKQSEWTFIFFGWQDDPTCRMSLQIAPDHFESLLGIDEQFNAYPNEERDLQQRYNLTHEQLNWRRWTVVNKCQRSLDVFNQEYPHSPEVAFLVSGRPALDLPSIARYQSRSGLTGSIVQERVGVEQRLMFAADRTGFITIYKKPEEGGEYVAGCDTAEGIDRNHGKGTPDPDFSVTQVLDRYTGEQVAVLRGRMYEKVFGQLTAWLCQWYDWAYVVPEVQRGYGRAMLDAMLAENYPMDRIYHRRSPLDQTLRPNMPRYDDLGWETNTNTRPMLVSTLNMALMERSIELHDTVTIQELRTFVKGPSGKPEAQVGCHDDTVIALGLAVIGLINAPRLDARSAADGSAAASDRYSYSPRMRDKLIASLPGMQPVAEQPTEDWYRKKVLLGGG